MTILLISRDLMLPSRLVSIARQLQLELTTSANPGSLPEQLETGDLQLVLVDLTLPGCSPEEIVAAVNQADPAPRLVGFGPHVQEAMLLAAQQAGFDEVISNGQLQSSAAAVLKCQPLG